MVHIGSMASNRSARRRISTVTPHTRPLPTINSVKGLECLFCRSHVHFLDSRCSECRILLLASRKAHKKHKTKISFLFKAELFLESKLQKIREKLR